MASGEVVGRAECGCCGMWEECTLEYIGWVRARFGGVWVCGLCEEAIKDERARLGGGVEVAPRGFCAVILTSRVLVRKLKGELAIILTM
ncbi:hypothetical protein DKX38_018412 [Salix brachista]|uniref:DUF1677 domain-containing protein n=1 Tax=Salix brachista TaxID=2182728 RepID=A0A5N5KMX5_9ROSI|nr:hypothetical protein DKX38_018412 [Salix brachista]